MFEWIASPEAWIALGTLAALEIVLGIDNIIFISVLVGRLPEQQRAFARRVGLSLAMIARLGLLFSISWIMGLTEPLFALFLLGHEISGRDRILIGGGLFLLAKATHEIHSSLEGVEDPGRPVVTASLGMTLAQIAVLDIVFSLDSVITAVGLVNYVSIMAIAIVLAVVVMMMAAEPIGNFVDRHPTIKILALSFLILV
ncbi:MAG: TerC family protein, partial [Anaerolineales bacterium]